jgi:TBC1 domain family protein 5
MLALRSDFLILFPNCTGSALYITPQILKGNSQNTLVHSAIWKFFLVVAPSVRDRFAKSDDWVRVLGSKRKEFHELRSRYFVGPPDDDESDPLAAGDREDRRWKQYFSDNSLRATISRDTTRTFQELDYFQSAEVQQILEDILFLYCRTHPHQEYAH